ncbi:M20/M25/M40 family metallo-hydrolase [Sphingomonas sp. S2-65]|uniref:M20/M25/M40 family metallo-hydrolase n=1 Tax=Sphingomonas sp. S2-65 TaxID=2903960 RepID=UPI001F46B3DE|nr:M20/M25/M40 family metallo-hydrolase [Sphingomonas sp. S2-65]UYY60329.1 M20/M25/M40 family metallo-hydrolase [Sphingomonas sp. S2-65]
MPVLLVLLLGLAALPAAGQQAPAFSADAVRKHVEFLASDQLEGREAGSDGYEMAARYVAERFAALGLKPGGSDGGWYQQVPIAQFELDEAKPASVTVGARRFLNREDVLIAPTPRFGSKTQAVEGAAVFVGRGMEADYAGLDVRGKFAVALLGGSGNKVRIAARQGALGLIQLVTPQDETDRFRWEASGSYLLRARTEWLGPDGNPGDAGPGLHASAYVKGAAARALFAGAPGSADQAFSGARGFALAQRVRIERTSRVKLLRSANVLGLLPGSDPRLAGDYVVLSAHLDHVGRDHGRKGDQIFNGAMDNAAGVATMLEAARAFAKSGVRPKRSILFAALTAEEKGLLGSDYLARHPVGGGTVVADVNLDMPILLYDFQDVVAFGAEHSTLGPIVARAGASMGVALSPDPMPQEGFFVRSDHYSFVKQGVPSVFLMTGFKNGGEAAFRSFLKTRYHRVSDEAGQGLNWQAGAKFAQLNYRIAREIADAAEAPRWYSGNSFGERYAKGSPKAPRPTN